MLRVKAVSIRGWAIRRVLRPAIVAGLAVAACAVFEPPLDNPDASNRPDSSAGGTGASGGSSSGTGGQSGSGGRGGVSGSSGSSGTGGNSGSAGTDAGDGSGGSAGAGGSGGNLPLGPWWKKKNSDGCDVESLPTHADRPTVQDGPSIGSITLAQSRIRIGGVKDDANLTIDEDAWKDIGFDIDQTCTLSPTCPEADAAPTKVGCKQNPVTKDGNRCRDNALGYLFPTGASAQSVGEWVGVREENWNCMLYRGESGILFRISSYNGQAYDPSVRLDVYQSIGTKLLPSWTCVDPVTYAINPNWKTQPPWLASRHWYISRRSIALNAPDVAPELPNAKMSDPAAFVRGGYLYAAFPPNAKIWLQGQRAHFSGLRTVLQRAFMVGRLRNTTEGWVMDDATIAGAVLPGDEVQSFREIGYCQNMCQSYAILADFFNATADVLSTTTEPLPNTPCDALSIGFSFNARQATADASDLIDSDPPVDCPNPKNPNAPRQGCPCADGGGCPLPDGGT